MNVHVIVPWEAGDDRRARAWAWARARWSLLGWPVTVAERFRPESRPWVKAEAVRPAIERVDEEIVVVADADVWTAGVVAAVTRVWAGTSDWAVPHDKVVRLTEAATDQVLDGADPATIGRRGHAERPYRGCAGGGMVVVRRELALDVPLDLRFAGWGGEDLAWGFALDTLAGPAWRGTDPLFHLWHPPQDRISRRVGSTGSEQLLERYRAARFHPAAMRLLLDEQLEVSA